MERKYFVANDNGDLAGHDMDLATAEQCLAEMQRQEPNAGWEIMSDDEDWTVREVRANTRMNQKEFANYFGIPIRTLQEWEQGRRNPPSYVVNLLRRVWELEKEITK